MISIALATYNGELFLNEQMESLINQTITEYEIVICDDNSTDSTYKILLEYKSKYSFVKVFRNERNLGFKKNFEKIIGLCSGNYIAFCDQDDIWTSDHLEILLKTIENNYFVGANSELIDQSGNRLNLSLMNTKKQTYIPSSAEYKRTLCYSNIFQGACSMGRTEFLKKCLPIPENVKYHDWWFALIASMDDKIVYSKNVVLFYRQHENNVTRNNKFNLVRKTFDYLFNKESKKKLREQWVINKTMLMEYEKKFAASNLISVAIKYYDSCLSGDIKAIICHFFTNYKLMFLAEKKSLIFIFRLINYILCSHGGRR